MAIEGDATNRVLVGVSYFAGWWKPLPNKWNYDPAIGDWRPQFPERVPLLGKYNEQPTMDKEIIAASRHSVDFFLILWYYNGPNESQERETNARYLNDGLKTFVNSPEAYRMKFAIEMAHPRFTGTSRQTLLSAANTGVIDIHCRPPGCRLQKCSVV